MVADDQDDGEREGREQDQGSESDRAAPPPNGWEIPRSERSRRPPELESLAQLFAQLLTAIPDELQVATVEAVRALLEALKAVLDWLASILTRGGGASGAEPDLQVHDIPIL
jgi:non-ribosomal peptide synthetase component F